MRFFETILSGAAILAAVFALEINEYPTDGVVAGQTYTITYSPKDNTPTTFVLRQGPSGNLNTIETITSTATGGTFTWTVPRTLANEGDYALEIRQGETVNYSGQFPLTGGSSAAPVVSSARPSATSAVASPVSSASAQISSIASVISSAQPSITASAGVNSTVASPTLSRSTSGRTSATSSAGIPESTGAASSFASSPLAALFAIAGFAYLA